MLRTLSSASCSAFVFMTEQYTDRMAHVIRKKVLRYTAFFEPDAERKGYTVTIPALPGCISEGDTFEDAFKNITEAAELYIETAREQADDVPRENDGVIVAPVHVKA
jgi:antitoxin HicB